MDWVQQPSYISQCPYSLGVTAKLYLTEPVENVCYIFIYVYVLIYYCYYSIYLEMYWKGFIWALPLIYYLSNQIFLVENG